MTSSASAKVAEPDDLGRPGREAPAAADAPHAIATPEGGDFLKAASGELGGGPSEPSRDKAVVAGSVGESPTSQAESREEELACFEAHVERFIRYLADVKNLSPNTVRAYETDLQAYVGWCRREAVSPLHVEHRQVRSWVAELAAAGYATTTQNRHLSAVRTLYKWLVSKGVTDEDAVAAVSSPKLGRKLPKTMGDDDVRALLAACDDDAAGVRDAAMVELLYATGARISEASGLNVSDVDLAQRQVRLFGKGSKERVVPVYPRCAEAVSTYMRRGRPALASAQKLTDALFLSSRGNRMSADALRVRFERLVEAAGLDPGLTPHAMRHTFATELLDGGADLRSVQELLGHESLSTTQIYTHLSVDRLKQASLQAHPRSGQ